MWSQLAITAPPLPLPLPLPTSTISSTTTSISLSPCLFQPHTNKLSSFLHSPLIKPHLHKLKLKRSYTLITKLRASIEQIDNETSPTLLGQDDQPNQEVEECVKVLKNAAKTRKVPKSDVLSALAVIEKAKLDSGKFLETLGGSKSPGRTWMLIFTAEKKLKGGRYFPITAVQRFDAEAKRIENGVYLGPLGCLTFEGRLSWKKRILAFIFERIRIKVGPFKPLEVSLRNEDNREPNNKDPFFIWFYVDEEIAVARGRGGGTAFWCRCSRLTSS